MTGLNAVDLIAMHIEATPDKAALWFADSGEVTFRALDEMARRVERRLDEQGIGTGKAVVSTLTLSPLLYAATLALARRGCPMILIEPWMPLSRIQELVGRLAPAAMIGGNAGWLWALRSGAMRRIPHWISARSCLMTRPQTKTAALRLDEEHPCIITFTSGTTGAPKGTVRSHAYLGKLFSILGNALSVDDKETAGGDLCIFANFALINLAAGKTSLVIGSGWKSSELRKLDSLPDRLAPRSGTIGPAFAQKLLDSACTLAKLGHLHIGGALSDLTLIDNITQRWPQADMIHIYGGSEVEPVALSPLTRAAERSREAGYFQMAYLGKAHSAIRHQQRGEGFWVTGPHVGPEYVGDDEANRLNKWRDDSGTLWHRMGDRIKVDEDGGLWYQGREQQPLADFEDEQKLYHILGHSRAMIDTLPAKGRVVIGESLRRNLPRIRELLPNLDGVYEGTIKRDVRHRARIDRETTRKGRLWRVG